jgi:hypothetical protein
MLQMRRKTATRDVLFLRRMFVLFGHLKQESAAAAPAERASVEKESISVSVSSERTNLKKKKDVWRWIGGDGHQPTNQEAGRGGEALHGGQPMSE